MNRFKKILSIILKVIQALAMIGIIISGLFSLGWYISWLDNYLMWHVIALIIGWITFPFFPYAVIIEWIWHGWPAEISIIFIIAIISWIVYAVCYYLEEKICGFKFY